MIIIDFLVKLLSFSYVVSREKRRGKGFTETHLILLRLLVQEDGLKKMKKKSWTYFSQLMSKICPEGILLT